METKASSMILTENQAKQVWDILVDVCGAENDDQSGQSFVHHAIMNNRLEFRFQGKLGFGGKIYVEEPPRVSCYQEDNTPERADMIANANEQLCLLWGDWESEK